jgi:ketosteroid isomerase-like protein
VGSTPTRPTSTRTSGHDEPVEADPQTVVLTALERLNAHDLDGYYELCADDFAYIGTTERRGIAEARAIDEPLFAGLPDHWRRVDKLLVSGDTVVVWLTLGGTPVANGVAFEAELCDVIEVRDGKIQSLRMYADWPAFMAKLAP